MTRNTNRDNIKPMGFIVAIMMMVVFCLCLAVMALQNISTGQFAATNGPINSIFGFLAFWKAFLVCLNTSPMVLFAFFTLSVSFTTLPAFFALLIQFFTRFALILITIFTFIVRMKFRNRLDLLAITTGFVYDCFRHGFSPLQKSYCLEPYARPVRVSGLFYYSMLGGKTKFFLKFLPDHSAA